MLREETKEFLKERIKDGLDAIGCEPGQGHCVGVGVSDEIIHKMEDEIGLKFSDDYIEFLSLYGEANLGGYRLYGYAPASMHGEGCSVVEQTEYYRGQELAEIADYYIISSDEAGNPIGCKPDGSVWLLCGGNVREVMLASSFDIFLYNVLTETLYKDGAIAEPAVLNEEDQEVMTQVVFEFLLFLEFSEHQDEDECIAKEDVMACQEQLISHLQKLSPECKKVFSDFSCKYVDENHGDEQKAYLDKIADIIAGVQ